MELEHTQIIVKTRKGNKVYRPASLAFRDNRIEFLKSPFDAKDDIKAMKGSKWHGFETPSRKVWSVADCRRNRFQLELMKGQNPYEWFDQPLKEWSYQRPLMDHQILMANCGLTYHYQILAAEMGLGKTLSAMEIMEQSGVQNWWWVGPKSGLKAVDREFTKWELAAGVNVEMMTYEKLVKTMTNWTTGDNAPQGIIYDESSLLKGPTSQRSRYARDLTEGMMADWGTDSYIILMSGTPSPKSPLDWWSQAEICYPGFIKEGNHNAFKARLAFLEKCSNHDGGHYLDLVAWRDDENRCATCGEFYDDGPHDKLLAIADGDEYHAYSKSKNEVAFLAERLKGLVVVLHKEDCIQLPEKRYRVERCEMTKAVANVAKIIVKSAPNVISGLTWLRELSDGFQYREVKDGKQPCKACKATGEIDEWYDPNDDNHHFQAVELLDPEYVATLLKHKITCPTCKGSKEVPKFTRKTYELPCPKEDKLSMLLDENDEQGRIVIFAGFTGSVDRVTNLCLKKQWDVVRVDGRGWLIYRYDPETKKRVVIRDVKPLDYWANVKGIRRVAFVAHPKSGGMALTLTEARMAVFWSNDFDPSSRRQAEDRIHRKGMDANLGATIVDLFHLPYDEHIRDVLAANRRLELMTLGEDGTLIWNEEEEEATA